MANLAGPKLLQAFFDYAPDEALDSMDDLSKARLRLSCKNAKAFVDGTVTTARGRADNLRAILRCDWHLSELFIERAFQRNPELSPDAFTSLLQAVCLKFSMLQELKINASPVLEDLPINIGQLSELIVLKLGDTCLKEFPASFGQLSLLEELELHELNEPDVFPTRLTIEGLAPLKQLTQLRYLKLTGGLVCEPVFPRWLGSCNFPVLEELILGDLHCWPSCIGKFTSLTSLIIRRSHIKQVLESIGSLELLTKFYIWYDAVNLPTSFSKLTALEELGVKTDMQSFALVEHCPKLELLQFTQTMEGEVIVPYPEFLWTFTSLQILHLSESAVPSLPDALGNLKNLALLHLERHKFLQLPETIGNLTRLTYLKIENCSRLEKLPESLGNLKLLRELSVHCRRLRTLPESIGDLQSLEELHLRYFESTETLLSSIGKLRALKVLTVEIVEYAGKVFLPESFADLVLDKPAEECALENVSFIKNTKVIISGPKSNMALGILWQRGVLHCDEGFNFS
jgi:Leucine-rich repeat (LRR) protein